MEAIWTSNDPGEAFLWNLRVKRANELVQSQSMLATLRYDMELFRFYQKAYGAVFEQQGIDLFGEVYKASEPSMESKVETKVTTRPKVRPLTVTLEIDQLPDEIVNIIELFCGEPTLPNYTEPAYEHVPEYNSSGHYGHCGDVECIMTV